MRQPPPGKAGIWRAEDPPRALEKMVMDSLDKAMQYFILLE